MIRYNEELTNILKKGKEERKYLCERSFLYYITYYFADVLRHSFADFHYDWMEELELLSENKLEELLLIGFKESAKTGFVKMFVCWVICYRKKKFIAYDSYVKENATTALFDIITELQTNQRILEDFGQLYTEDRKKDRVQQKVKSSFITKNKIKVIAFSTQESPRGANTNIKERPDLWLLDDIENSKTIESNVICKNILAHYSEIKTGKAVDAGILVVANFLSENGVIADIRQRIDANPKGVVEDVPLIDRKGNIMWPSKYVKTDLEAEEINKTIKDTKKWVRSVEAIKRDCQKGTESGYLSASEIFRREYLNDPSSAEGAFFDRRKVDADIERCVEPVENKAGFRIWKEYNPEHRYCAGADTSMGVGRDSCTSVFFDLSTFPNQQVGSYDSNTIAPNSFAHELKREGDIFGTCLIAPEVNARSGGTCINEFRRIYPLESIYRRMELKNKKVRDVPLDKFGWETTSTSRPEMFMKFKRDYEDGKFIINDIKLLKEMRSFSKNDILEDLNDPETTRHFDLLTAACIGWFVKDQAEFAKKKEITYEQPAYESPSLGY